MKRKNGKGITKTKKSIEAMERDLDRRIFIGRLFGTLCTVGVILWVVAIFIGII